MTNASFARGGQLSSRNMWNYKLEGGKPELELKRLFAAAETLPGSSAECERSFSMMNETVWDKCNRLRVESVSSTMFSKLNGVPLDKFDPYPYPTLMACYWQPTVDVMGTRSSTHQNCRCSSGTASANIYVTVTYCH